MNSKFTSSTSIICLLFACFSLAAQTNVSGGIFVPTTWNLSSSPYIVTDDIVVFPDQILTIEAGVIIKVLADKKIELRDATLIVAGTESNKVHFSLEGATPGTTDRWAGIVNHTTSTSSVFQLDHFVMEHAVTGIHFGPGNAYRDVHQAEFRYNDRGIYDGGLGYNWVRVYDSHFHDNLVGLEGRSSAFDCVFEDNEYGILDVMSFQNSSEGGRVIDCLFENNIKAISAGSNPITFAVIEHSTFTNNNEGVNLYWAEVNNCQFVDQSLQGILLSKGFVENSFFLGNQYGVEVSLFPWELTIRDNQFDLNDYSLWVNGAGAQIENNSLCGGTIYDAYINTPDPVDLTNNCWCTDIMNEVDDRVFDAYDDVSAGIATFLPPSIMCMQYLIFPGDCDNNGIVNEDDVLAIALKYGSTGPARVNPSNNWIGQMGILWGETLASGLDLSYIDADGNGLIDENDLQLVLAAFENMHGLGNVHSFPELTEPLLTISLEASAPIIPGEMAYFDIILGQNGQSIPDIYGFAGKIAVNGLGAAPSNFALSPSGSFLGNPSDLLSFVGDYGLGQKGISISRKNQSGVNSSGKIGTISFMIPSNANGTLNIQLESTQILNKEGMAFPISTVPFNEVLTAISQPSEMPFRVFPNPADQFIKMDLALGSKISIFSIDGKLIFEGKNVNQTFDVGELNEGVYWLKVVKDEKTLTKKIWIKH